MQQGLRSKTFESERLVFMTRLITSPLPSRLLTCRRKHPRPTERKEETRSSVPSRAVTRTAVRAKKSSSRKVICSATSSHGAQVRVDWPFRVCGTIPPEPNVCRCHESQPGPNVVYWMFACERSDLRKGSCTRVVLALSRSCCVEQSHGMVHSPGTVLSRTVGRYLIPRVDAMRLSAGSGNLHYRCKGSIDPCGRARR